MVIGSVVAPGARPAEPTTDRKPLPHSSLSLTRRKSAFSCSAGSFWSDRFFSLKVAEGTSLFCPLTMPRSYQPVVTMSSCKPLVRSTVGPQPADPRNASSRRSLAGARMRAILEHPHLNPVEDLFARDLAGEIVGEIRSTQPDDAGPRIGVGRREPRPGIVALGRDGQQFQRADAKGAAVRQHRILQRLDHFGTV